jgi:hypothetical protein
VSVRGHGGVSANRWVKRSFRGPSRELHLTPDVWIVIQYSLLEARGARESAKTERSDTENCVTFWNGYNYVVVADARGNRSIILVSGRKDKRIDLRGETRWCDQPYQGY